MRPCHFVNQFNQLSSFTTLALHCIEQQELEIYTFDNLVNKTVVLTFVAFIDFNCFNEEDEPYTLTPYFIYSD